MKKSFLFLVATILFAFNTSYSQNLEYTKEVLEKLCSPELYGRGYVNRGDSLAADYIASEMARWKLKSFGANYFQHHTLPVNSQSKADVFFIGNKGLST